MRKIILGFIRLYQLTLSPLFGPRCRFYPTCSHYTAEAVRLHGPAKGTWLGVKRIVRCHPLNEGGIDLVPAVSSLTTERQENSTLIKEEQAHG